jgi:hypothetical protein
MNPSSPATNRKVISRSKARNCMVLNLLATPGLGSLSAGRIAAGLGQLLIAVAGFVLFVIWFVKVITQTIGQFSSDGEIKPVGWMGVLGGAVFAAAWFWSLVTSLSVNREAKNNEFEAPQPPPLSPPKI